MQGGGGNGMGKFSGDFDGPNFYFKPGPPPIMGPPPPQFQMPMDQPSGRFQPEFGPSAHEASKPGHDEEGVKIKDNKEYYIAKYAHFSSTLREQRARMKKFGITEQEGEFQAMPMTEFVLNGYSITHVPRSDRRGGGGGGGIIHKVDIM